MEIKSDKDCAPAHSVIPEDADFVLVPLLSGAANMSKVNYYKEVKLGRAPRPRRGVPRHEAVAWLESRAAEAAALAAAATEAAERIRAEGDQS